MDIIAIDFDTAELSKLDAASRARLRIALRNLATALHGVRTSAEADESVLGSLEDSRQLTEAAIAVLADKDEPVADCYADAHFAHKCPSGEHKYDTDQLGVDGKVLA